VPEGDQVGDTVTQEVSLRNGPVIMEMVASGSNSKEWEKFWFLCQRHDISEVLLLRIYSGVTSIIGRVLLIGKCQLFDDHINTEMIVGSLGTKGI